VSTNGIFNNKKNWKESYFKKKKKRLNEIILKNLFQLHLLLPSLLPKTLETLKSSRSQFHNPRNPKSPKLNHCHEPSIIKTLSIIVTSRRRDGGATVILNSMKPIGTKRQRIPSI
jgi:hypothetical protein